MLSTNSNIKHFFGRKDFIVPNNERVIFLNQVHGDKVIDLEDLSSVNSYPEGCLLYTSPSPRDQRGSRMPSSA